LSVKLLKKLKTNFFLFFFRIPSKYYKVATGLLIVVVEILIEDKNAFEEVEEDTIIVVFVGKRGFEHIRRSA